MRLHCGFIKSEYLDVGLWKYLSAANQPAIILIFKNLGVLFDCMSCLFLGVVLIERLCGLFVVVVSAIDFTID